MQPPAVPGFPDETHARKQDIRLRLRNRRAGRAASGGSDEVAGAIGRAWRDGGPHAGPGAVVCAYLARTGEPGTGPLREHLAATGCRVLVPWLRDDGDLDWIDDPGPAAPARLRPGGDLLGVGAVLGAAVVLLPALAADTWGRRLGQGGGSYDRVLERVARASPPHPLLVACVHDDEVFDGAVEPLPEEAHDRRVDAILTPRRFIRVSTRTGPP